MSSSDIVQESMNIYGVRRTITIFQLCLCFLFLLRRDRREKDVIDRYILLDELRNSIAVSKEQYYYVETRAKGKSEVPIGKELNISFFTVGANGMDTYIIYFVWALELIVVSKEEQYDASRKWICAQRTPQICIRKRGKYKEHMRETGGKLRKSDDYCYNYTPTVLGAYKRRLRVME